MTRRQRIAVAVLVVLVGGAGFLLGRQKAPRGIGPATDSAGDADSSELREQVRRLEREVADLRSRPEPVATLQAPTPRGETATPPTPANPTPAPAEPAAENPFVTSSRLLAALLDPVLRKGLDELRELAKRDLAAAVLETRRRIESTDAKDRAVGMAMLEGASDPAFLPLLDEQLSSRDTPPNSVALMNAKARIKDRLWSPKQLLGAPDTPLAGDFPTAWASKSEDMGEVWIELDYAEAVRVDQVRVHETFNPGAIARVYAKDPSGAWDLLWEGRGAMADAPSWFDPPVARTRYASASLRIVVDTDRVGGWNEIDAVELVGDGVHQWATAARAQSAYSDS